MLVKEVLLIEKVEMDGIYKLILITALGIISAGIYIYLLVVKKSPLVRPPSLIVIVGLIFIAVIGGLIRYSQIYDQSMNAERIFEIVYFAMLLPSIAIGVAVVRSFGTYLDRYMKTKSEDTKDK